MGTFYHSKSNLEEPEDILLEEPKASLNFFCWELFDYGLDMKMKLSTYIKEIRLRQASIRKIKRLNTHMSFMLGSQFSCLTNLETRFQIVVDKLVLYKKIKCYNAKEILIEDEEDVDYIHFVKARPGRLFKHELEALKHKFGLTSLYGLPYTYSTNYMSIVLAWNIKRNNLMMPMIIKLYVVIKF